MNQLKINQLCKTYPNGVQAMQNISLEISNGMFGLLGPNGAGKSTLMKTIAGLQTPDSGNITFNGIDLVKNPVEIKKQLGFLPQDFGVYPKISALGLLSHIAVLKGLPSNTDTRDQLDALLQKTNLFEHRHKEVHTFSGGMRQRFGVAQALLGNPQIVIVDEPTAGLDPEERNRFNNLLSEIGEEIIVILSTHLVEDVRNLCTNMAVIQHGSVLAYGKPADFIAGLDGKLWQKSIGKNEAEIFDGKVLSAQLVSGQRNIHLLADEQPDGFAPAIPTLEDVYFSLLNKNS